MRSSFWILLGLLFFNQSSGALAGVIDIDDFTNNVDVFDFFAGDGGVSLSTNLPGGNTRMATVDLLAGSLSPGILQVSGGNAFFSQGTTSQARFTLDYDFMTTPRDLTDSGVNEALFLSFASIEQETAFSDLTVTVDGVSLDISGTVNSSLGLGPGTSDTSGVISVAFANFAGVDFSDVTSVAVTILSTGEKDFTINSFHADQFTAVPEPSAAVLMSIMLLGVGSRRRKR